MQNPTHRQRIRSRRGDGLEFLKGFMRAPDLVGSVIPSSRFLERRLVQIAHIAEARVVVEFGPGTGGTTRAILRAMAPTAKLLAIEIDPRFAGRLQATGDPRLIVHHGSAEHIRDALLHHGLAAPDAVLSGIPFSTMPPALGQRIINAVWDSLAPGGRFVAYQFRDRVATLGRELLGDPEVEMEILNAPPVRIYHWQKGLNGVHKDAV